MTSDPALAALKAADRELAALRELIEHLEHRTLAPATLRKMKALLPAAHFLMGAKLWTARELVVAASEHSAPVDLAAVIKEHVSVKAGNRSFGWFLASIDGITADGYRLDRVGTERNECVYTVVRVSPPPKLTEPLASLQRVGKDGYTFVKPSTGCQ